MARTFTIDSVDRTSITRVDEYTLKSSAFRGEVGAGSLVIDDPSAAITIDPLEAVTIVEDASTPSRIFTGYTAERKIRRGPLTAGTQRQWKIVLEDLNVLFDDILLGGDGTARRPEESDVARVTWLLTTTAMSYYSITAGQVPSTNKRKMGPEDYRGRFARDVLEDCSNRTGKNFYLYDSGAGFLLYYDKQANADTSPISISDVLADINGSTVFGPSELDVLKDPERKFDRVRLIYKGGTVTRGTVGTGTRRREKRVVNKRIRSRSRARDHADNILDQTDAETVEMRVTASVPASVVGDIRAGQSIPIKLTHAGIAAYTDYRIRSVSISPRRGRRGVSDVEYDVAIRMADEIRPTHVRDIGSPGGGIPDDEKTPDGGGQGGGGTADGSSHVLDDYDRTDYPAAVTADTDSTGTSHVINVPDGADVIGRRLVIAYMTTDLDASFTLFAAIKAAMGSNVTGNAFSDTTVSGAVLSSEIDGTEAFLSTSAVLDAVTTSGSETILAHALLLDPASGSAVATSVATEDPPSLNPVWDTTYPARWMTFGMNDGAISGDPTGYSNVHASTSAGLALRISAKDDDSATEDPDAYTMAGSIKRAWTLAIYSVPLGRLPRGVDTGAWWEGGNPYQITFETGTDDYGVDGNLYFVEASSTGASLQSFIETNDGTYVAELPTELADGWSLTGRFRLTTAGSLADAGLRRHNITVVTEGRYMTFSVFLGDTTNGQGVGVSNDAAGSDTAAKDITEGDWWRWRMTFDPTADTISGRIWAESATEPTAYDVTLATSSTSDDDGIYIRTFIGNNGGTAQRFEVDWMNLERDTAPGGSVIHSTLPQLGDDSTTQFTIPAYLTGTLTVWVDGINVIPSAVDPAAGTFTLDRAPATGARIDVLYEAV